MLKKLTLLAMAVTALVAFAVPAVASAATGQLTQGGESLEPESTLTAFSTNTETETTAGTLSCATVHLEGVLTTNSASGSTVAGGAGTTAGCKVTQNSAPVTITDATFTDLKLSSTGGSVSVTFISHIAGALTCHFSGTVGVTWSVGSSSLHIEGKLTGTGAGCPTSGAIRGDFALSSGGTPVTVD